MKPKPKLLYFEDEEREGEELKRLIEDADIGDLLELDVRLVRSAQDFHDALNAVASPPPDGVVAVLFDARLTDPWQNPPPDVVRADPGVNAMFDDLCRSLKLQHTSLREARDAWSGVCLAVKYLACGWQGNVGLRTYHAYDYSGYGLQEHEVFRKTPTEFRQRILPWLIEVLRLKPRFEIAWTQWRRLRMEWDVKDNAWFDPWHMKGGGQPPVTKTADVYSSDSVWRNILTHPQRLILGTQGTGEDGHIKNWQMVPLRAAIQCTVPPRWRDDPSEGDLIKVITQWAEEVRARGRVLSLSVSLDGSESGHNYLWFNACALVHGLGILMDMSPELALHVDFQEYDFEAGESISWSGRAGATSEIRDPVPLAGGMLVRISEWSTTNADYPALKWNDDWLDGSGKKSMPGVLACWWNAGVSWIARVASREGQMSFSLATATDQSGHFSEQVAAPIPRDWPFGVPHYTLASSASMQTASMPANSAHHNLVLFIPSERYLHPFNRKRRKQGAWVIADPVATCIQSLAKLGWSQEIRSDCR